MAIKTRYIQDDLYINWSWPIRIGYIPSDIQVKNALLQIEFNNAICHFPVGQYDACQIIIISTDFLPKLSELRFTQAAAILFLADGPSVIEEFTTVAPQALKQFKAAGIFLVHIRGELGAWLTDLVNEMALNKNLIGALQSNIIDGSFFFSPKLERDARLGAIVSKMIYILEAKSLQDIIYPAGFFKKFPMEMSGVQLLANLKSYKTHLPFTVQQSSEVTDIITKIQGIINQYVPQEREEHSNFDIQSGPDPDYAGEVSSKGNGENDSAASTPPDFPDDYNKSEKWGGFTGGGGSISRRSIFRRKEKKSSSNSSAEIKKNSNHKRLTEMISDASPDSVSEKSRYLQMGIRNATGRYSSGPLKPKTKYFFDVYIGSNNLNFINSGKASIDEIIFEDIQTESEPVQIHFTSNLTEGIQAQTINLPRSGDTRKVSFDISTGTGNKQVVAQVYAYHNNRLIQHDQFTAYIKHSFWSVLPGQRNEIQNISMLRKQLKSLSTRQGFSSSLLLEKDGERDRVHGISNGKPVDLYFADGLQNTLVSIKQLIEQALKDDEKHPADLNAPGNQELLVNLALHGNEIYKGRIENQVPSSGPLQIITNYPDYLPLEFIYTYNPPDEGATICTHAVEALKEGKCKGCYDHTLDPAPHVCPFGFWTFSRIVERHGYDTKNSGNADYLLVSEPAAGRDTLHILQNSIHACSKKVDGVITTTSDTIAAGIQTKSKQFHRTDKWNNWTELMKEHKPETIFLVVHTQKGTSKISEIEIGDADFMKQTYFGSKVLVKDLISFPPPLVIIIGCDTSNIADAGFDIAGRFLKEGAAIVMSNFTKIRGPQAKDIVVALAEFLEANAKTAVTFGEVMLKLRQHLLAKGIIAGMSLMAQGDADWKIKT